MLFSLLCVTLPATPTVAQDATIPRFEPGPCPIETATPLEGVDCGDLVVYENRDDPAEGTMRLAVSILYGFSDVPGRDPLVTLSGGPRGLLCHIYTATRCRSALRNERLLAGQACPYGAGLAGESRVSGVVGPPAATGTM